jgi:beta-glucosidase
MKKNKLLSLILVSVSLLFYSCNNNQSAIDKRVETILSQMTLEEKVGQMTQITLDAIGNGDSVFSAKTPFGFDSTRLKNAIEKYKIGSVLNTTNNYALTTNEWNNIVSTIQHYSNKTHLKIPIIYGIDAIHGSTYAVGATMFPQQIALAATFNPQNAYNMASICAYETRACGSPWNFSPVRELGADPRFSRQFEGFGEDPFLGKIMGEQIIKGYEGKGDSIIESRKVASCLKHFLAYSVPNSGKDRTPAYVPEHVIREYHLPQFKAAIDAGAESVMINSGLINGISVHASYEIITKLLKEELGFEGVVVTDWMDIINLQKRDKIAANNKEAIKLAINAGIDMSMVPYDYVRFCDDLVELVKDGEVKESRIDDAVRRILKMKLKLGLFEKPVTFSADYPDFASAKHEKMAYESAAEAITLLKNADAILPLKKDIKILVTGPNANSMRSLNGGWSYSWQGDKVERFATKYNTIFEALLQKSGAENVKHIPGVSYIESGRYFEEQEVNYAEAIAAARNVDVVLLCLGENSYTEKPGDLNDLNLSALQTKLATDIAKSGKPIILVLNEGRPRCISAIEPQMKAIVQTYLPGNYGGNALAYILYGDVNPSGKLPYTYPAYPNSIVNYYHKFSEEQKPSEGAYKYESDYNPQYEFGYGLSYTTFEYSDLKINKVHFSENQTVTVSVNIKNTGTFDGKETVMLFSSDKVASISPDVKRLRKFEKVFIKKGETKTVNFTISASDLAFVNQFNRTVTESGEFELKIANLSTKIYFEN